MNTSANQISIDGMRSDYSRYALTQFNVIQADLQRAASTLIKPLAKQVSDQLHIVDLGTADGVNGFPVIERFIKTINDEATVDNLTCTITHVDVPAADFSALQQNVYHRPDSYYQTLAALDCKIQPNFVAGSFYEVYAEAESADIVFSTTALHYASTNLGGVRDHVDPLLAHAGEKPRWDKLSRSDLDLILQQAHRALKPGGKFWAVSPAHRRDDKTGKVSNHWNREIWKIMVELFEGMVEAGELDAGAWQDFVIPVHQRHIDEWEDWFEQHPDLYTLDYAEVIELPNPYLDSYLDDHGDRERFADDYIGMMRAWGERIVAELIPDLQRRNQFFGAIRAEFAKDPERFADDNISIYIGATKR